MMRCAACGSAISDGHQVTIHDRSFHETCSRGGQAPAVSLAYDKGWEDAVRLYAVWRNGEQLVGVKETPLDLVLQGGPPADQKAMSLGRISE